MTYGPLSNAPIVEAVADVWAELRRETSPEELRALRDSIGPTYEKIEEQRQVVGSFGVTPDGVAHSMSRHAVRGYLFSSKDGRNFAQVRMDGFSFNRLKPYDRWANFRSEAERLWAIYASRLSPVRVSRLGLRYINRIDLPPNPGDLKGYFRTIPEIGPGLPQALASYFMRLVIPLADNVVGIVTQGIERPDDQGRVPLMLDIEVRLDQAFAPEDPAIWAAFETMRHHKNTLFLRASRNEWRIGTDDGVVRPNRSRESREHASARVGVRIRQQHCIATLA